MPSDAARFMGAIAHLLVDPPPGTIGHDRDGALIYFGCKPWEAGSENQVPGQPPAPQNHSAHQPDSCPVCGGTLADSRVTCASCMASGLDSKLTAELAADIARAAHQAEARKPKPRSLAERRYGDAKPA